ncbi:hypothetical protein [Bacillus sp. UNC41MFS5]|uniref:hypothetical protein n=1 Tax=Bacillus sp. UNC41MFS5 TaxID=1449046 RepID=UPI00047EE05B|nr:hypothetical protein [Bacillus sp. UNC41MFS5]
MEKKSITIQYYPLLKSMQLFRKMSCIKLPDEMPLAQASLIGCGVATGFGAAVNAAGVTPGSTVAIFGGGAGVNAIQGARIAGASKIIACDVKQILKNVEYSIELAQC